MSSAAQIETEWSGLNVPEGGDVAVPGHVPGRAGNVAGDGNGGGSGAYPSDEEILGMDPVGASPGRVIPSGTRNASGRFAGGEENRQRDSSATNRPRNDNVNAKAKATGNANANGSANANANANAAANATANAATDAAASAEDNAATNAAANAETNAEANAASRGAANGVAERGVAAAMPEWMRAIAADSKVGAEAQQQVQQLWQEHQAFRAAFASPDEARAIKELFPGGVQEAQALREGVRDIESLRQSAQAVDQIDAAIFSGDARAQSAVVAELAQANPAAFRSLFAEAAKVLAGMGQVPAVAQQNPALRENREGWGTPNGQPSRQDAGATSDHLRPSPDTNHESQIANRAFDPTAYAAFERSTNDTVARDVRASVSDTLARVLPEGVGDGAARRIGDDIFNEIHRTLAADRTLSEQVGEILRGRQFGANEQARVAQLLAGRAKQLVPSVARRVIGEWTTSVLGTARNKAARQAAAASRVDIAAPGGSLDSMPLRPMSAREVDYGSMSDDEILEM